MATTDIYTVAGGLHPTRHAVRFIGGNVDDGITNNALWAAIVAGNHTKGTITAWVMVPDLTNATQYGIISAGDNNSSDEYMHFSVIGGKLQFQINDGAAARVNVITTNVCIPDAHQWVHVAVVQDGVIPKIYVNGVEQALTLTTATELGQWFDDTDGIDNGAIGALYSNNAYLYEYKGYISDVKVWSGTAATAALTAAQVLEDMQGKSNTTSLLAHYKFDGNALDAATGGTTYQGTIVGDIIYVDANEFASRFTFGCGTALVADKVLMGISNGMGFGYVIQAA